MYEDYTTLYGESPVTLYFGEFSFMSKKVYSVLEKFGYYYLDHKNSHQGIS